MLERIGGHYSPEMLTSDQWAAWQVGRTHYLALQSCDDGWDYTLYNMHYQEVDGGQLNQPELAIQEARNEVLAMFQLEQKNLKQIDYDMLVDRVG